MKRKRCAILAMALACVLGRTAMGDPWEWELLPSPDHDLNVARHGLTGEAACGNVYAIGGVVNPGGPDDAQNVVSVYDPNPPGGPPHWSFGPSLPTARHSAASAVLDGCIYVVGGHVANSRGETERFCCDGTWDDDLAPLNTARSGLGLAAYDGNLYAFGGNHRSVHQSSIEVYDPDEDDWDFAPCNMPMAGDPWRAVTLGDKIYLAGGGYDGAVRPYFWSFDPNTCTWDDTTLPELAVARTAHELVVAGDMIFAIGGYDDGDNILDSVEYWDSRYPESDWQQGPSLNVARSHHGAAVLPLPDGTFDIYVFGGVDAAGVDLASTERLHIPEPATLSLLALGGLAMIRRQRQRAF